MRRKAMAELEAWLDDGRPEALVISGPRQVGKTYLVEEFGRSHFNSFVTVNLEADARARAVFEEGPVTADSIYDSLKLNGYGIESGGLLFLDEIQACPAAYSSLKQLAVDGRCRIAASGSILGLALDGRFLSPMGYVRHLRMGPMDFEEFLWAMGMSDGITRGIARRIRDLEPFKPSDLDALNDLFKRYVVIGGMPASVRAYAETRDYAKSVVEIAKILDTLREDARRYIEKKADSLRVASLLEYLPRVLSKERKNLIYSEIAMVKAGNREYKGALTWLERAGVIDICYCLESPEEPFVLRSDTEYFKVYFRDTGMLTLSLGPGTAAAVVNGDYFVNNGALMENAVMQALLRKGYTPYYFQRRNSTLELDFVVNLNGTICAIEVKSGRNKRSKSLTTALGLYRIDRGIKVSDSNLSVDGNGVIHYPLFGPSFFEDVEVAGIGEPPDMDALSESLGGGTSRRGRVSSDQRHHSPSEPRPRLSAVSSSHIP